MHALHKAFSDYGCDLFLGVPCSHLAPFIESIESNADNQLVHAVREDLAIGIAVGAYLAGRKPLVFMQNSAIGTAGNALTSLALLYEIPIPLLISWRGYQDKDAPEHKVNGENLTLQLKGFSIPVFRFEVEAPSKCVVDFLNYTYLNSRPAALVVTQSDLA